MRWCSTPPDPTGEERAPFWGGIGLGCPTWMGDGRAAGNRRHARPLASDGDPAPTRSPGIAAIGGTEGLAGLPARVRGRHRAGGRRRVVPASTAPCRPRHSPRARGAQPGGTPVRPRSQGGDADPHSRPRTSRPGRPLLRRLRRCQRDRDAPSRAGAGKAGSRTRRLDRRALEPAAALGSPTTFGSCKASTT